MEAESVPPAKQKGSVCIPTETGDLDGSVERSKVRVVGELLHEYQCEPGDGTIQHGAYFSCLY